MTDRNLYIGDLVAIEIGSDTVSDTEIHEAFTGFDVVDVIRSEGMISVTLRTLTTGSFETTLEGQEIVIQVNSTLVDIPRDDIFESQPQVSSRSLSLIMIAIFLVSVLVCVVSSTVLLIKGVKKRNKKTKSAYDVFMENLSSMDLSRHTSVGEMTKALKIYLSYETGLQLIGLTTDELMNTYKTPTSELEDRLFDWLRLADVIKYTGENRNNHLKKIQRDLMGIVNDIEVEKGKSTLTEEVAL